MQKGGGKVHAYMGDRQEPTLPPLLKASLVLFIEKKQAETTSSCLVTRAMIVAVNTR